MENKKAGCAISGNRLRLVDPNDFVGGDLNRNIPVPNEDLTIQVKLTSYRRGRTVIIAEEGGDNGATSQSSKSISVSFFDGSLVNGRKTLTTKFTDLTTVFELDSNNETLGITNIDIDFDTSIVPKVTIDFIDVRGSSIFQNEDNLKQAGTENPYSVFFDFPYPLFELEVKGYYGYPVKYCLHMVKFNSKFNSQTGNFEIRAEFIGYTYAMLADMLIGVLKANQSTKIGAEIFAAYNQNKENKVPTIHEFRNLIATLSEELQKASQNSENSQILKTFSDAKNSIEEIENTLKGFSTFDSLIGSQARTLDSTRFIIRLDNTPITNDVGLTEVFNSKNENIKTQVNIIKNLNIQGVTINYDELKVGQPITDLTKKIIDVNESTEINGFTSENLLNFKKDLNSELTSNNITLSDDSQLEETRNIKQIIERRLVEANQNVAIEVRDTIAREIKLNPNVRNIIEIFTSAIETFLHTIYKVSTTADNNENRKQELDKIFAGDTRSNDYVGDNYHPWPSYYEKSKDSQPYTEKFIGSSPRIENRNAIPEVEYIDNLLNAFIYQANAEKQIDSLTNKDLKIYLPTNVLDLPLNSPDFLNNNENKGYLNPYLRIDSTKPESINRLILLRAITFFGYTNDETYIKEDIIKELAENEAKTIINSIKDEKIKRVITTLNINQIVKSTGTVNKKVRPVVNLENNRYFYNYLKEDDNSAAKLLPIGYDIDGKEIVVEPETVVVNNPLYVPPSSTPFNQQQSTFSNTNPETLTVAKSVKQTQMIEFANGNLNGENIGRNLFLTNYGPFYGEPDVKTVDNKKYFDGGIYVKILTKEEYTLNGSLESNVNTDSKLILESLKQNDIQNAGFNPFGGVYGIQDFTSIDFANGIPADTPSMYVFYSNDGRYRLGLSYTRKKTDVSLTTAYDLNINGNRNLAYNKLPSEQKDYLYKKTTGAGYYEFSSGQGGNHIHGSLGKNRLLATQIKDTTSVTYPYISQYTSLTAEDIYTAFSLFGSKWYYLQKDAKVTLQNNSTIPAEDYVKALLFLNTIPFNIDYKKPDPFNIPEIRHLFDISGGFVHAPRLWVAYVGGLLWWMSKENPETLNGKIVGGGRGIKDPIIWKKTCGNDATSWPAEPSDNHYLPKIFENESVEIDDNSILLTLPIQVKNEFKKVFFDFVNGGLGGYTSFKVLKDSLEIFDGPSTTFCGLVDKLINTGTGNFLTEIDDKYYFNGDVIKNNFKNYGNYKEMVPVGNVSYQVGGYEYIFLELKDESNAVKKLLTAFNEELIIANTGYAIWRSPGFNVQASNLNQKIIRTPISVTSTKLTSYLTYLLDAIKQELNSGVQTQEDKTLFETFNTADKEQIKLMLYNHCKNVYEKWLAGVTDENNIIFQCGQNPKDGNNVNVDKALSVKYNNTQPRLIDSFRFVTRSFKDIGDEMFIDPTPIGADVSTSPNMTSYNMISKILTDNKFTFHSLPTFINFYDEKVLKDMFKPFSNYDNPITSCGPSFVSVYAGQPSIQLDFNKARFPNDGFDIRCDLNNSLSTSVPEDFKQDLRTVDVDGVAKPYEDPVSVFSVKYSQQNQNIFKDISLDQTEFAETEESLKIISDIADKNGENQNRFAGQNMYNVYAVRSYSAEIEMLGNAMVQPLMYFQLDNIPMFHGAYMITRVRHNIKPNHMSTIFTGTRIRAVETPIFDVADAYSNLIKILEMGENATGSANAVAAGSYPPLVATIAENQGSNGNPFKNNITSKLVPEITDVYNAKQNIPNENILITEATDALVEMLNAFVIHAKSNSFPKYKFDNKKEGYISINSLFRNIQKQRDLYAASNGDGTAAYPGNSNHGWGVAVDFQFLAQKEAEYLVNGEKEIIENKTPIPNNKRTIEIGFNIDINPSLKWFLDNSYKFGFIIPQNLREGKNKGVEEFWHFEYHGTSAKCLYNKQPSTYGYTPKVTAEYKSIVKNPKGKDNKVAVYTGCDYRYIKSGDGSESNPNLILSKDSIPADAIYKQLKKDTKLSDEAIAGIMGNLFAESRFVAGAFNADGGNKGAYGLAQWRADRQTNLIEYAKKNKLKLNSKEAQIGFLNYELVNKFTYTLNALKNVESVNDACEIFYVTYERTVYGTTGWSNAIFSEYPTPSVRYTYAQQYYQKIKNNSLSV